MDVYVTVKLTEQWTTLDHEYAIEEQGLKLMLKTNNEKRIEKQTKNSFDKWENVLFGRNIPAAEQCHKDVNNFVIIRCVYSICVKMCNIFLDNTSATLFLK